MLHLKCSAVELLEVMLEETSARSSCIRKGLQESLDRESLLETMHYFKKRSSDKLVKLMQMDDNALRGMFRAYHVLVSLGADSDGKNLHNLSMQTL